MHASLRGDPALALCRQALSVKQRALSRRYRTNLRQLCYLLHALPQAQHSHGRHSPHFWLDLLGAMCATLISTAVLMGNQQPGSLGGLAGTHFVASPRSLPAGSQTCASICQEYLFLTAKCGHWAAVPIPTQQRDWQGCSSYAPRAHAAGPPAMQHWKAKCSCSYLAVEFCLVNGRVLRLQEVKCLCSQSVLSAAMVKMVLRC